MAKPSYLQLLEKGKLLTAGNFPEFVNTWNYSVNRLENIKGDRDSSPQSGHITVDNADPEHPVIRFVKDNEEDESEECVKSIEGDGEGSELILGAVTAQGAEGSGLKVTTTPNETEEDEPPSGTMEIDVADRTDDEEYGGREIEMDGEVVAKVFGTTDFEITQKEIVAGDGIEVTEEDNVITISATGETEIEAGAGIEVDEGTVSVNPDGVSIETRSGSEVSDQKVQLLGFNSISNYRTETTVGDDLLAESESGDLSIVASLVGSAYVIRYKPLGILDIDGAEGSGLEVTRESESGSNSMKLDLADRGQTSFGVHDVNVGGSSTGVKVFSSEDVDVLDIEAGDGIQVSKSGNKATVSLTGGAITDVVSGSDEISCSKSGSVITVTFNQDESESESETDGYTGTETVVTGVTYDTGTHQLSRTFKTWTFSNGILTSVSEAQTAVIETAVQEASDGR